MSAMGVREALDNFEERTSGGATDEEAMDGASCEDDGDD